MTTPSLRITAAALGMTIALAGCRGEKPDPNPPVPVTVVEVGTSDGGSGETRYSGSINADASVDVAFKVSGVVDEITQTLGADGRRRNLQDGDPVRRKSHAGDCAEGEEHPLRRDPHARRHGFP